MFWWGVIRIEPFCGLKPFLKVLEIIDISPNLHLSGDVWNSISCTESAYWLTIYMFTARINVIVGQLNNYSNVWDLVWLLCLMVSRRGRVLFSRLRWIELCIIWNFIAITPAQFYFTIVFVEILRSRYKNLWLRFSFRLNPFIQMIQRVFAFTFFCADIQTLSFQISLYM